MFIALILCVTTFLLIFLTKASSEQITKISGGVSICLAMAALILSVYSTYFVYDQSKVPNLELEAKFTEWTNISSERAPIISQLGGIFQVALKNVGDKDAVSAWMNGRLQLKENVGEDIEKIQLQYYRITKGSFANPYSLKKLRPSSAHSMLIAASCANCLEIKQWWVDINTQDRSINVRPLPLGRGMWEVIEPW